MASELCSTNRFMLAGTRAFSLLEVVVALAMLALIAIPAVGLATMAVSRSREQMTVSNASELKNRIDNALRAYDSGAVFTSSFIPSGSTLEFLASESLEYIELGGNTSTENDAYYKVTVREPVDYSYDTEDAYRIVLYEVVWPDNDPNSDRKQLFFTTVFRK